MNTLLGFCDLALIFKVTAELNMSNLKKESIVSSQ